MHILTLHFVSCYSINSVLLNFMGTLEIGMQLIIRPFEIVVLIPWFSCGQVQAAIPQHGPFTVIGVSHLDMQQRC